MQEALLSSCPIYLTEVFQHHLLSGLSIPHPISWPWIFLLLLFCFFSIRDSLSCCWSIVFFILCFFFFLNICLFGAALGIHCFSSSVMSDSLPPHELQHTRPPCPSPTPRVYPKSCPLMCVGFFWSQRVGTAPCLWVCGLLASLVAEHGALDP